MSNLRDRLRDIASRPAEEARIAEPAAPCRIASHIHDVWIEDFPQKELELLGASGTRPIFLDTETTGLMGGAGTLAMLVGIGKLEAGKLRVAQYYMSDYDQEEEMLRLVAEALADGDFLVTYNGKSFDVPLLRSRFVMARRSPGVLEMPHVDLLHGARRVFRKRLHACALIDIESQVLGVERLHDLPGKEVPEYWFRYVKTGDQALMDEILTHNEQDIVSLALLLDRLLRAYREPKNLRYRQDTFSVGRVMERAGELGRAEAFYEAAGGGEALTALGVMRKRAGSFDGAVAALESAVREGGRVETMVEIAKIEEHRRKDVRRALHWTDMALAAAQSVEQIEELTRRRRRLSRKLEGKT